MAAHRPRPRRRPFGQRWPVEAAVVALLLLCALAANLIYLSRRSAREDAERQSASALRARAAAPFSAGCRLDFGAAPAFAALREAAVEPALGCRLLYPSRWPELYGKPCNTTLFEFKRGVRASAARAQAANVSVGASVSELVEWLASLAWDSRLGAVTEGVCNLSDASPQLWPICAHDADADWASDPDNSLPPAAPDAATELSADERARVAGYLGHLGVLLAADDARAAHSSSLAALAEAGDAAAVRVARRLPLAVPAAAWMLRTARGEPECSTDTVAALTLPALRACSTVPSTKHPQQAQYAADLACVLARALSDERARAQRAESAPPAAWRQRLWLWAPGDRPFPTMPLPVLAKARLIGAPALSVLLPLNHERHRDELAKARAYEASAAWPSFEARGACAVWRGTTTGRGVDGWGWDGGALDPQRTPPRRLLVERWGHATSGPMPSAHGVLIDVGYSEVVQEARARDDNLVSAAGGVEGAAHHARFVRPPLRLEQQAACKYVLSVEGNDVATNLKWALLTQSVVLMAPPTVETVLLESLLKPWVHYVPLRRDASDLAERLRWCEAEGAAHASAIARAGRAHVLRVLGQGAASDRRVASAVLAAYARAVEVRPSGEELDVAGYLSVAASDAELWGLLQPDGDDDALRAARAAAEQAVARGDAADARGAARAAAAMAAQPRAGPSVSDRQREEAVRSMRALMAHVRDAARAAEPLARRARQLGMVGAGAAPPSGALAEARAEAARAARYDAHLLASPAHPAQASAGSQA